MALLFRAIWDDSRPSLVRVGERAFLDWLRDTRRLALDALPMSELRGENPLEWGGRPFELVVRRADVDGVTALQVRLREDWSGDGERWYRQLTVLQTDGAAGGTLWVDVDRLTDDPFVAPEFMAPRLVRDLISSGVDEGGQPRVGHVRLDPAPTAIRAATLKGLVQNEERRLPLVVFSHDDQAPPELTVTRARAAYKRLAGVAQVYMLPPDQIDEFEARMGEDLGVRDGDARLYLPTRGLGGLRPWHHPIVRREQMAVSVETAGKVFARRLTTAVPATRPPPAYDKVDRALRAQRSDDDLAALLEMAEVELRESREEKQGLRDEVARRESELLTLRSDNERLKRDLARLRTAPAAQPSGGDADVPDVVVSTAEALARSRALVGVVIHPDAPRDIDRLDQAPNSQAWAAAIWRGLRALDSYAQDDERVPGGFWEWCQRSGSDRSWPASHKKLAMRESEAVMNNSRWRECRVLPVSTDVDPDGRIEMVAHLKIAEGGGPLAPRVYFYDDTKGVTGKVHVGFVGPHDHMPNRRTS